VKRRLKSLPGHPRRKRLRGLNPVPAKRLRELRIRRRLQVLPNARRIAVRMKLRFLGIALALGWAAVSPADSQQVDMSSGSVVQIVAKLKPGQYIWAPEIAPEGPMLLIVNLKSQRAVLYRNGVPIGASTVSTGRPGRDTPTGIFTILQKKVEHYSSKYDAAPMPYMERLTWRGVALHAGHLPGYPASHGCIRMPAGFAKLLYGSTKLGMTVVVADVPAAPRVAPTPTIVSEGPADESSNSAVSWVPERSPSGPVSVLISASDHRALVLRNGVIIGSAPVTVKGAVTGTWAYALRSVDVDGQHWVRLQLSGTVPAGDQVSSAEWQRFIAPDAFKKAVASIVQPGMTIVVTPDSLRTAAAPVTILESGT
jgi:L,D-transpeptidase-like protein